MLKAADTASGPAGDTTYGRGRLDVWKAYQLGLSQGLKTTTVDVGDVRRITAG